MENNQTFEDFALNTPEGHYTPSRIKLFFSNGAHAAIPKQQQKATSTVNNCDPIPIHLVILCWPTFDGGKIEHVKF